MAKQNHYAVLGLRPSADAWAIKRTYRRLIRECHPDVTDDPEAPARAAAITAAYNVLGDPERRARWDGNVENILNGWTTDERDYLFWKRTRHCLQCGVELHGTGDAGYSPTGRGKRKDAAYCSNACRQRAYRARKVAIAAIRKQLEAGQS